MVSNSIIIVGGGSAGWLSAAALIRYFPQKKITVVESKNIPTIGVGESTTATLKHFINCHLKINDSEFMPGTDAIYKMSVKFQDFHHVNDGGFHYPFGKPYLHNLEPMGIESWDLVKHFNKELNKNDFNESLFPAYHLFSNNKFNDNLNSEFDNFTPQLDLGYHLDANKLGIWLRDNYCIPKGVDHIIGDVVDVEMCDLGVKNLILENGKKINGDLYIDCSGFKSLLLSQKMNSKFIDVSYKLPNNRVWATPIKYKDVHREMCPYTISTALKNGWAWYTPIASRIGNGYAYSDQFIQPNDALEEFKKYLLSDKHPASLSKSEVDNLPFFELKMKAGYYEESMIKNVVGIGLSAGFLEPLEGTGIYFITESLLHLIKILHRTEINQWLIDSFNLYMQNMYLSWIDILSLFYAQTVREDSNYWKSIKNKKFEKTLLENHNALNYHGMNNYMLRTQYDHSSNKDVFDAYTAIAHGCDINLDIDDSRLDQWTMWEMNQVNYNRLSAEYKKTFDLRKEKWKTNAESSMNIYDYLKKNNLLNV